MKGRKIIVALVQITSALFLMLCVLVGYVEFSEFGAERKAREFCDRIKVGESTTGILERALEHGAGSHGTQWHKTEGEPDWMAVTFTGAIPLSRHMCWLKATDGKIASSEYVYFD